MHLFFPQNKCGILSHRLLWTIHIMLYYYNSWNTLNKRSQERGESKDETNALKYYHKLANSFTLLGRERVRPWGKEEVCARHIKLEATINSFFIRHPNAWNSRALLRGSFHASNFNANYNNVWVYEVWRTLGHSILVSFCATCLEAGQSLMFTCCSGTLTTKSGKLVMLLICATR